MRQGLYIVLLSIAAAVIYGILHDQITARICVEYFTVGHPPIFHTANPTLLGIGWGIVATWWVGLFLGIPLAIAARAGRRPKRAAASLLRPLATLLVVCGLVATVAGVVGYLGASQGWIWLFPRMAARLPPDRHVPFLVDLWAHNASYLSGFMGGLVLIAQLWYSRIPRRAPTKTDSRI